MKYKVGDKVKIRKDLVVGEKYGCNDFAKEMRKMLGKVTVIVTPNLYSSEYLVDGSIYWWTDEMIEGLYIEPISPIEPAKPTPQFDKSLLSYLGVSKVVFNNITTIVTLDDGTVGKSTASEGDELDWWVGFTIAYTSACLAGKNKLKSGIEALTTHTDPFFKPVVINVN